MKILFIICMMVSRTVSQEAFVNCDYIFESSDNTCKMSINNPNGLNNFTEISGTHLTGYTNADVIFIYTVTDIGCTSSNIPRIILNTFPNVERVYVTNCGVTGIDDETFAGCSQITWLELGLNNIKSISANAFITLPNLIGIQIPFNPLSTISEYVFARQANLKVLNLRGGDSFKNLQPRLFQSLVNLRDLELSGAGLHSIGPWFVGNVLKNLDTLSLASNHLIDIPLGAFASLQNLRQLNLQYSGRK